MTTLRQTPDDYLFNLEAVSPGEARKLWREVIKENWNYECAYCGSDEELTLDHVKPRSLGGMDTSINIICACESCNYDKGRTPMEEWYRGQEFFSVEREAAIKAWMEPIEDTGRYQAHKRKNICYANV